MPQPARTYEQWKTVFHEEAKEHYAELVRLGYHVSQPSSTVQSYCSFAAFDAIHLGKTEIDMDRARDVARRMAKVEAQPVRRAA